MKRLAMIAVLGFVCGVTSVAAAKQGLEVRASGDAGLIVSHQGRPVLRMDTLLAGPQWSRGKLAKMPQVKDGVRVIDDELTYLWRKAGELPSLPITITAKAEGADGVKFTWAVKPGQATEVTGIGWAILPLAIHEGATIHLVTADGEENIPLPHSQVGKQPTGVKTMKITTKGGEVCRIEFAQPATLHLDHGEVRIWAISGKLAAGAATENSAVVRFAAPIAFDPSNRLVDLSQWIPLNLAQDFAPGSPIGTDGWLEKPAGKHGWLTMKGENFVFEDGTPIKLWGTNISYSDFAVSPEIAAIWADRFAKYGVNFVRWHKFTGNMGWDGLMRRDDPLAIDDERAKLFDNLHAQFKNRGLYIGWSPIFTPKLHEGLKKKLLAFDEIKAANSQGMFANTLYTFSNFAPDVQDVYIELTTAWLNRKNSVTGLRYADDPALLYVELHNEADIFFHGTGKTVAKCPTYAKIVNGKFAEFLKRKHTDQAGLQKAWGNELKPAETLDGASISPFPNWSGKPPASRRVADSYRFLYEYQTHFYERYVAAIRKTGFKGAIVGGCWQAADLYGHLYNIASDRAVGFIDRHNYASPEVPMVSAPGSSLLSAGRQAVSDRPFVLSEWNSSHTYAAENVPVIGLIGLGVQGWDGSGQFSSNFCGIRPDNMGGGNSSCDTFYNVAQYPFIARAIFSNAIKEGEVVATRRISMKELDAGQVGFEERFSLLGGANIKSFSGSFPNEALGAGKVLIEFVEEPAKEKVDVSNLAKYFDKDKRRIQASNGQIVWDYSRDGYFTVDTPVLQGVVGFAGGREHALSACSIASENAFANIYLAAQKKGDTLALADRIVIATIARSADEGTVLEEGAMHPMRTPQPAQGRKHEEILKKPATLRIEPVKATVTLKRSGAIKVFALDHDGRKAASAMELPVTSTPAGPQFTLDGAKYKTMYYLVEIAR